jgi:5-(carboxyamino)imidazole ribonucleotide mutase
MPAGIPVGTLAIGEAGAVNAALLAASVLGLGDRKIAAALAKWRRARTASVAKKPAKGPKSVKRPTAKNPTAKNRA